MLLNAEFSYCRIWERIVEFFGFGDSDIAQPTVGLPHFCLKTIGPPVREKKRGDFDDEGSSLEYYFKSSAEVS